MYTQYKRKVAKMKQKTSCDIKNFWKYVELYLIFDLISPSWPWMVQVDNEKT